MKIVRTIVWVLLLTALLTFSAFNWNPVEVKIWDGLVLETKIPALVVIAFLFGLIPMWLLYQASKWNYERRISGLESTVRATATVPATAVAEPAPVAEPIREEPRAAPVSADERKPTP